MVLVAAKYGTSNSSTVSPPTVSADALTAVTAAATAQHGQDVNLSIEKTRASADTLAALKGYEEQIALGNISLAQAQAEFANKLAIADAGFANSLTIDQNNNAALTRQTQLNDSAAQQQNSQNQKTSFWNNLVSAVSSFFGKKP